jgi:hypothetical protein
MEVRDLGQPPNKFFMRRQPTVEEAQSRTDDEILLARSALLRTKYSVRAVSVLVTTVVSVAAGFLADDIARLTVKYLTTPMGFGILDGDLGVTFDQLGRLLVVLAAVFALLAIPASVMASANLSRRVDQRIASYREILLWRKRRARDKRFLATSERGLRLSRAHRGASRRA